MSIIKPSKHIGGPVSIPADPDSPNGLPLIVNAAEFLAEEMPTSKLVIHGVLSAGSTMVYGGASKTNKTYALMDLAISVASGQPWWQFRTEMGKVLYIDLELQRPNFQSRLQDLQERKAELKIQTRSQNLDLLFLRGKAQDISVLLPELEMKLSGKGYSLIIIDPIYKLLGYRDENSAGDINSLMNELERLAVATGAAIIIGHHFSKGGQAGKESMDRIAGSGVFGRSPDTIMIITRHEIDDVFTVNATLRNFKPIQPFCVVWDYPFMVRTDDYDPAKLKRPGVKKEEFTGDQLLKILSDNEYTTAEWREATLKEHNMSERTFNVKKSALDDAGKVSKGDNGKWKAVTATARVDVKDLATPKNQEKVQQQSNTSAALIQGAVSTCAAAVLS